MKVFGGKPRSTKWPSLRKKFLTENPFCAACGNTKPAQMEVHHIYPYSFPDGDKRELEWDNLVTLCNGPGKCHFVWGHLLSWSSYNPNVIMDVKRFYRKVETRPFK